MAEDNDLDGAGGTAFALPLTACAETSGTCGDNLTWVLDDEGTLTISGMGEMVEYSDDCAAPWGMSIKRVVIGTGVTGVGAHAFDGCSSLEYVSISRELTSIGRYAFAGCSSMTGITVPENVRSIGEYAFSGCTSLTYAALPGGLTSIASHAFYGCSSLTSFTIPQGVSYIADFTFSYCENLTDISIPDSVTVIERWALNGCRKLTDLELPDALLSIGEVAFMYCENLKTIALPDGVSDIGLYAFMDCGLTRIDVPRSVTNIGEYAFGNDEDLLLYCYKGSPAEDWARKSGVNYEYLSECVTHVEEILEACEPTCTESGMTQGSYCTVCGVVLVPQEILPAKGHRADFKQTQFTLLKGKRYALSDLVSTCEHLDDFILTIQYSEYESGRTGVEDNMLVGYVTGEDSIMVEVSTLDGFAVYKLLDITIQEAKLVLPEGLTVIEAEAFTGVQVSECVLSGKVQSIGTRAFADCASLVRIEIPASVISIAADAFEGCDSLTIIAPEGSTAHAFAMEKGIAWIAE